MHAGRHHLVVLHGLNVAARYCDRLVLLDRGAVVCAGPPEGVLTPGVLEPVYRIGVRVLPELGCVQLLFAPLPDEVTAEVTAEATVAVS